MTRSTRFFEIIQMLRRATAPMTAAQMAETLEVTKRTIYRDIASLQASGLPIDGEAGVGYILRAGYDLPPIMLDEEEREAIVVGLALLGRTGDQALEKAAVRASAKIADAAAATSGLPETFRVSEWNQIPEGALSPADARRYIREETELQITYRDEAGRCTNRCIHPIALIYCIDVLVLAAWCVLRDGLRHFRLDRVQAVKPTSGAFHMSGEALRRIWQSEDPSP
ncbi:YafY family protein [uncultured Roseobacter sp.]|uniref:helix-turn-helix transcriptional regulator n=1 Tax=uncultured Roseobacter sp. TaxID=114847 RepID=UPI002635271A|nr:YafY family protein [uncultured Roseobacter sp.]